MPLTREEFAALQVRIEAEEPIGSPARILLAEILEQQGKQKEDERRKFLAWLRKDEGFTEEQAERAYEHIRRGGTTRHESRKCHLCRGSGHETRTLCMGFESVRCTKCNGSGRGLYLTIEPEAPETIDTAPEEKTQQSGPSVALKE